MLSNIPGYRITSSQSLPAAVPSLQPLPLLFPPPPLLFPSFHPSAVQSGDLGWSHFSVRLSYIRSVFPHSKGRWQCVRRAATSARTMTRCVQCKAVQGEVTLQLRAGCLSPGMQEGYHRALLRVECGFCDTWESQTHPKQVLMLYFMTERR